MRALSQLWGLNGELWSPSGPLTDYSYAGEECVRVWGRAAIAESCAMRAGSGWVLRTTQRVKSSQLADSRAAPLPAHTVAAGYMQNRELPPFPPVTRWLSEFQAPGLSDDQALQAAVAWAHEQPTDGASGGGKQWWAAVQHS